MKTFAFLVAILSVARATATVYTAGKLYNNTLLSSPGS